MTTYQYNVVKLSSSDGMVDLNDAEGELCIGITQQKAAANQSVAVCVLGISNAVCGAAVTKKAAVKGDGSGRVIEAGSADLIIGYALETGAALGDIISVLVVPAGIY
jgi:hypothetical protein